MTARLLLLVFALFPLTSMVPHSLSAAPAALDIASPCTVVWHSGGNSPADRSRLIFALWDDGVMIIENGYANYLVGKVVPADQTEALARIRSAKFYGEWGDWVVPCGGYITLFVREGKDSATHSWHGNLDPHFGGDLNRDAKYRDFIRMWRQSRGAIDSLTPLEIDSLAGKLDGAGEFRGFRPADASRTSWRP